MKTKLFISMICGLALVCGTAVAQPGMGGGFPGGGMPPMGGGMMMGGFGGYSGGAVDMAPLAVFQTEQLSKALNLTEKQAKQIKKIYKKELDRRMNHMLASGGGNRGGFGGMMGGGFPGGGMPPMGGGMPPMGGGFPGGGNFGGGFPGAADAAAAPAEEDTDSPELKAAKQAYERLEQMEETNADLKAKIKIEKKMQKILTEEQYSKWSAIQNRPKGMPMPPQIDGAEFDLNNIPEEYREQFLERMRNGRPEGAPQGFPQGVPPQGFPQGVPPQGVPPQGNPAQ